MNDYLVLNSEKFPLWELLGPEDKIPPGAILDRAPDRMRAGLIARALILGRSHRLTLPARRPVASEVVVRGPDVVMHYDRSYQTAVTGSGRHRFLCGNWPNCAQPARPWRFYQPPSKTGRRLICAECRRRNPSQKLRDALANFNRSRTGIPRAPRKVRSNGG